MRPFLLLPLALILLPLAGCEEKKPEWAKEGAAGSALPPQICSQVKKALEAVAKNGGDFTDKGEATLPAAVWDQMATEHRDQFAKTVAYHASCAAGAASDGQEVAIRADDGSVLMRRTISTRVDMSEILGPE